MSVYEISKYFNKQFRRAKSKKLFLTVVEKNRRLSLFINIGKWAYKDSVLPNYGKDKKFKKELDTLLNKFETVLNKSMPDMAITVSKYEANVVDIMVYPQFIEFYINLSVTDDDILELLSIPNNYLKDLRVLLSKMEALIFPDAQSSTITASLAKKSLNRILATNNRYTVNLNEMYAFQRSIENNPPRDLDLDIVEVQGDGDSIYLALGWYRRVPWGNGAMDYVALEGLAEGVKNDLIKTTRNQKIVEKIDIKYIGSYAEIHIYFNTDTPFHDTRIKPLKFKTLDTFADFMYSATFFLDDAVMEKNFNSDLSNDVKIYLKNGKWRLDAKFLLKEKQKATFKDEILDSLGIGLKLIKVSGSTVTVEQK